MTLAQKIETLKALKTATNKAFRALMNDPNPTHTPSPLNGWTTHTPEIKQAYEDAAAAECAFRTANDLLDWPNRRRGG